MKTVPAGMKTFRPPPVSIVSEIVPPSVSRHLMYVQKTAAGRFIFLFGDKITLTLK